MVTRTTLLAAAFGLVAMMPPALALQDAMTEEEYDAAMKEIRFTVSDAQGHIDARYWPELETEVGRLQSYFTQIESFWTSRGTDEAAAFAQEALEALEGLLSAAGEEDQAAARDALKTLQGSCGSCHMQFREETAGGFRIKP